MTKKKTKKTSPKKAAPKKKGAPKKSAPKKKAVKKAKPKNGKWLKKLDYDLGTLSRPLRGAGSDEWVCGHKLACEVFGLEEYPKNDESGLKAFPYLYRRFGEPSGPGDEYKDLCEYILSTPNPDVAVRISPRGSGLAFGVGYYIGGDLMKKLYAPITEWWQKFEELVIADTRVWPDLMTAYLDKEFRTEASKKIGRFPISQINWREGSELHQEVNLAIIATLKELLRSESIRDVNFNILGLVE